ncbi:hypothetical protein, partial [Aeromonas sp. Y318-3]|uniref:hypothetical protein n=1 Tax=Aeromonas sp. Y318-3 TaxID=2990509 RepID=UPI0022E801D3
NKMRTPDQIAEKSESSIKSQGMIPPWVPNEVKPNVYREICLSIMLACWASLRYALRQPTNHAISTLPPLGPISGSRLAIMLPQISPVKMPTLGSAFSRNWL